MTTPPVRVALLGPANSVHLQRWAIGLADRGLDVCVISQHAHLALPLPPAVALHALPMRGPAGYFANAWSLARLLRLLRPDLLNVHYASGYGSTAMLTGFTPCLLSVWGSDVYEFPYQSAFKGWLLRRNLRSATALAATSQAMAAQLRRLVPEREAVAITPFGVDLKHFCPADESPVRAGLTLGTVKTLAWTYGIDLLLRAFAALCRDAEVRAAWPEVPPRLLIVGDGPQRAELQALAGELGISGHCEFVGAVTHDAVPQWLHCLDIYVAPSRAESFGVAVIEAGACGLPVVVSDAGGLPEVVVDGHTGLVVPRDDVPALLAALKRLALDSGLRNRLGRQGRDHVARGYAWGACVDRMKHCYDETISSAALAARAAPP